MRIESDIGRARVYMVISMSFACWMGGLLLTLVTEYMLPANCYEFVYTMYSATFHHVSKLLLWNGPPLNKVYHIIP